MGNYNNCTNACCSESDKRTRQIYIASKKSRPHAKSESDSQSMATSNIEAEEKEIPISYLDNKTVKLLSSSRSHQSIAPNAVLPDALQTNTSTNWDELEKRVSHHRVNELSVIKEPCPYFEDDEDSEGAKLQIEQRKSGTRHRKSHHRETPSLYRSKTASDWDQTQIDILHNEMEKQLLTLTNRESTTSNTNNFDNDCTVYVDYVDNSSIDWEYGSLFGHHSVHKGHKWDAQAMVSTAEEMQKETIRLMSVQQTTPSSSTM